jgi:hypothetical protein
VGARGSEAVGGKSEREGVGVRDVLRRRRHWRASVWRRWRGRGWRRAPATDAPAQRRCGARPRPSGTGREPAAERRRGPSRACAEPQSAGSQGTHATTRQSEQRRTSAEPGEREERGGQEDSNATTERVRGSGEPTRVHTIFSFPFFCFTHALTRRQTEFVLGRGREGEEGDTHDDSTPVRSFGGRHNSIQTK